MHRNEVKLLFSRKSYLRLVIGNVKSTLKRSLSQTTRSSFFSLSIENEYRRLAAIEPHDHNVKRKLIERSSESIALPHVCDR